MEVFRNRAPLNFRIRSVQWQAVDGGETRRPVSSSRLTSFELIPFEARLVSAAIESSDGLYVRITDDVLSVGPNGQVTRIHMLDEQSSFGFKGLALHQGSLWTFDQSLVEESVLTAISLDGGEVRAYGDVPFRRPEALVVVDGELLVLDRLVPTTEISLFQNGQKRLVGEARNLTHWLVRDDALLWSENEGIWQWQAGRVTQLVKHPGILTFDRSLNFVAQLPAGDENAMTVNAEGTALPVKTGQGPVALHTLSSGSLVQFAKELAPLHTPQDRQAFPSREELGPVLNLQDQVVFLSGSRQLASSSNGRTWLHTELPVKCTRLVQAGSRGFIGSSRQGSVWIRFLD